MGGWYQSGRDDGTPSRLATVAVAIRCALSG